MTKEKKASSLTSQRISRFFSKYHMTVFFVFIIGCLVAAVVFLYGILNDASIGGDYESPISAGSIDQATLERLNSRYTSDQPLPDPIPSQGRVSPFSE